MVSPGLFSLFIYLFVCLLVCLFIYLLLNDLFCFKRAFLTTFPSIKGAYFYMYVITDCFNFSFSEDALVLAEMFPEASSLEIRNCLMVSNGDVESAVQLMLLKKENIDDEGKENCHQVLDLSPKVHHVSLYTVCTACTGTHCFSS